MATLGLIGSGNIGSALARSAIEAGYDVVLSNSRGPETLADLVADLGPKASAATPADDSWRYEPDTPAYGTQGDFLTVSRLGEQLAAARR